jgi:hypothetical protein
MDTRTSWHSYPKIYSLGHRYLNELLLDPVIVEEKVDGSQISFGLFNGELRIRSKGADINPEAPEKMFRKAVDYVKTLGVSLVDGWTYRAEYLAKPKHNVLAYDRIPKNNLILFDINFGEEVYSNYQCKKECAEVLGLEVVPRLFEGMLTEVDKLKELLETVSVLGGQKIEGVVIKNYNRLGLDKKALMGKFVSESFKEVHNAELKTQNPGKADIIDLLIAQYRTPARWAKAAQHLKEAGQLEGSPRDIEALIKEAQRDLEFEAWDEITSELVNWALPKIKRGSVAGLPEWYKDELMKSQFEGA